MRSSFARRTIGVMLFAICFCLFSLGCNNQGSNAADAGLLAQALFVAHNGALVSYDIATGSERPGTVSNLISPTDMQSLEDGTVLVNLTGRNEVLAVNGRTMLESARPASSSAQGTRPVHSYISPERTGKRYWVALNDGASSNPATSSARFIDIKVNSSTFLQPAGEVSLGIGHHKASFSNTLSRVVVSNISDPNVVLSVFDYTDISSIRSLASWSAADLHQVAQPSPHGCATSKLSGIVYCNMTGTGDIVAINIDAPTPSQIVAIVHHTHGSGAGYTRAHKDGRYIYSLQDHPREGSAGGICQVGQLVVIDSQTDAIAREMPLLYRGPSCSTPITGTDEATTEPGHILVSKDSKTLYVGTAGGFGDATARVRQEMVVNIADPANPIQLPSVPTGASTGNHGDTLSGDGRFVFVTNSVDGTVTQIDTSTNLPIKTLTVRTGPQTVSTFGSAEGPSEQTGPIL